MAVLFDKPTLRTQTSFAAGIAELGGYPMIVDGRLAGIGVRDPSQTPPGCWAGRPRRSSGAPSAKIDWRRWRPTPAFRSINALTDSYHPCQVLADLQTIRQHKAALAGLTLAYVGDGANNMAHSYALGGAEPDCTSGSAPRRASSRIRRCWRGPRKQRPARAAALR